MKDAGCKLQGEVFGPFRFFNFFSFGKDFFITSFYSKTNPQS